MEVTDQNLYVFTICGVVDAEIPTLLQLWEQRVGRDYVWVTEHDVRLFLIGVLEAERMPLLIIVRDKAIVETPKAPKSKKESIPSTSRWMAEQKALPKQETAKVQPQENRIPEVATRFRTFETNNLQINLETRLRELANSLVPMYGIPSTSTTISLISEASIKSSVSSIMAPFVGVPKSEETPSFYQTLVIPFSGFTEADVKEIRGGREPKSKRPGGSGINSSNNTAQNERRPVLKRFQSEKRKSSYERYVQESLENFLQKRNNTEESSYNTVLAVKMMVNQGGSIQEKASIVITEDQTLPNSKDTMYLPNNSELLNARLDRIMNPPSSDNSLTPTYPEDDVEVPTPGLAPSTAECSNQRSKWMSLRKELEQLDKEFEQIQDEFDEAEKAYFTAKLNFHKTKMRRDKLIAQLKNLEVEFNIKPKCNRP